VSAAIRKQGQSWSVQGIELERGQEAGKLVYFFVSQIDGMERFSHPRSEPVVELDTLGTN